MSCTCDTSTLPPHPPPPHLPSTSPRSSPLYAADTNSALVAEVRSQPSFSSHLFFAVTKAACVAEETGRNSFFVILRHRSIDPPCFLVRSAYDNYCLSLRFAGLPHTRSHFTCVGTRPVPREDRLSHHPIKEPRESGVWRLRRLVGQLVSSPAGLTQCSQSEGVTR